MSARKADRRIVATALLAGWTFAASGVAENRIVINPELDDADQGAGWIDGTGGGIAWLSDDDADGCHLNLQGSGSLAAVSVPDGGGPGISVAAAGAGDCLNVQPLDLIQTEIAYRSPFIVGAGGQFFPQADCAGVPDIIQVMNGSLASDDWARHAAELEVPAGRFSMRVFWASFDFEDNSIFQARFDRAYAGARERVFSDDFEATSTSRWSSIAGSGDATDPTNPSAIASPSHDGGPAPPPLEVSWGHSVEDGGAGLAFYRVGIGTVSLLQGISCSELFVYGLDNFYLAEGLLPDDYVFAVCAEDRAGNQSAVVFGGPYTVN